MGLQPPPNKRDIMHIGCIFSAYHATSAHVKQNHALYGTPDQNKQLLIQSQRRTCNSFAEAYEATARDFEISCPKYTLASIIQWHLSYEGSKLHNELEDFSRDPLILRLEPPGVLPESHSSSCTHVQLFVPSSTT